DRAIAIRAPGQRVWLDSAGVRGVTADSPASKFIQGEGIAAMERNDCAHFPITDDGIYDRVQVVTELFAVSERKLVSDVTASDMCLIVVAGAPFLARVVDILPTRLSA